MVVIAEAVIGRRSSAFEPASSRDCYKEALRELVEAKTKGLAAPDHAAAGCNRFIQCLPNASGRVAMVAVAHLVSRAR